MVAKRNEGGECYYEKELKMWGDGRREVKGDCTVS
jgi:hypothetical protein